MVSAGNKAERLLLVNHITKTTHRHHHQHAECVLPNLEISNFEKDFQIAFNSLNDYFSFRKPIFSTKTLHNLQGQYSRFHCLMAFQNSSKSHISIRLLGTRSHICRPIFDIPLVP